jgi:hypothetical protein
MFGSVKNAGKETVYYLLHAYIFIYLDENTYFD